MRNNKLAHIVVPLAGFHEQTIAVAPCTLWPRHLVTLDDCEMLVRWLDTSRGGSIKRGRVCGAQVRRVEVAAGGGASVAADPGPQLLLVQSGRGVATPDSSFQHPEVLRSLLLPTCADVDGCWHGALTAHSLIGQKGSHDAETSSMLTCPSAGNHSLGKPGITVAQNVTLLCARLQFVAEVPKPQIRFAQE